MNNLFKWKEGRQGTGYKILTLLYSKRFHCDSYIIKLPTGVEVPPHRDNVPAGTNHYRFNIHFSLGLTGGRLTNEKFKFNLFNRIYLFRPDISTHSVSKVEKGNLYIFSVGWLTKQK